MFSTNKWLKTPDILGDFPVLDLFRYQRSAVPRLRFRWALRWCSCRRTHASHTSSNDPGKLRSVALFAVVTTRLTRPSLESRQGFTNHGSPAEGVISRRARCRSFLRSCYFKQHCGTNSINGSRHLCVTPLCRSFCHCGPISLADDQPAANVPRHGLNPARPINRQSRKATFRIALASPSVFINTRCHPWSTIVLWSACRTRPRT